MKFSWEPAVENLRSEVEKVRSLILDSPFNSDFGHNMHIAKMSLADIISRIDHSETIMRNEADSMRAEINAELRKMQSATSELRTAISELRLIKAQRNRENYLHILEIKKAAEEGGEA